MIKWDKESEALEAKLDRDDVKWSEKEKAQKRIEKLQLMQDRLSTKFNTKDIPELDGAVCLVKLIEYKTNRS